MGIDTQGMSGPTDPNYKGNPKAIQRQYKGIAMETSRSFGGNTKDISLQRKYKGNIEVI